jgi:hypothetical protein
MGAIPRRIVQCAAHEAGHAVVTMAVGVPLNWIVGEEPSPSAAWSGASNTFYTQHDRDTFGLLDMRLQYLTVAAGFAGETVLTGMVDPVRAQEDLVSLHACKLTNEEIQLLTAVAIGVVQENRKVWEMIHEAIVYLHANDMPLTIEGLFLNSQFRHQGKRFTDTQKLFEILPDNPASRQDIRSFAAFS